MTVILNEAAIATLLESPPVVAFVERTAQEKVVPEMKQDIRSYFVGAETGVENDVGLVMQGSTAIVGLRDDPEGRSNHPGKTKASRYARVGRWEKTRAAVGQ